MGGQVFEVVAVQLLRRLAPTLPVGFEESLKHFVPHPLLLGHLRRLPPAGQAVEGGGRKLHPPSFGSPAGPVSTSGRRRGRPGKGEGMVEVSGQIGPVASKSEGDMKGQRGFWYAVAVAGLVLIAISGTAQVALAWGCR